MTEYEKHSIMLGQIAELVREFCPDEEMTTLEAVENLLAELWSETRWANHYCRKLVEARRLGFLPDDFNF